MAGCVDFSRYSTSDKIRVIDSLLYYPNKLMAQNACESHIPSDNFQIGRADSCLADSDEGLSRFRLRDRVLSVQLKEIIIEDQCAHFRLFLIQFMTGNGKFGT